MWFSGFVFVTLVAILAVLILLYRSNKSMHHQVAQQIARSAAMLALALNGTQLDNDTPDKLAADEPASPKRHWPAYLQPLGLGAAVGWLLRLIRRKPRAAAASAIALAASTVTLAAVAVTAPAPSHRDGIDETPFTKPTTSLRMRPHMSSQRPTTSHPAPHRTSAVTTTVTRDMPPIRVGVTVPGVGELPTVSVSPSLPISPSLPVLSTPTSHAPVTVHPCIVQVQVGHARVCI